MNRLLKTGLPGAAMTALVYLALSAGCAQEGSPGYSAPQAGASRPVPGAALQSSASTAGGGEASLRDAAPPGSLPGLDEEVWVIVRPPEGEASPAESEEVPGTGAIMGRFADSADPEQQVPLPLNHTEVETAISAYIASVTVRQEFYNPYEGKIEALYVFPLPQNAAVNGFVMTVGERRIRGIIREREEARQIYEQAKRQGHVASLLTQERANIFTQHVANIEPGHRIDIDITYFHTLAYDDGWYEYVFPMVVGPRFNPPHITDGVGAVPRGRPGSSGQATEVAYMKPHERSGHDIGLSVRINAGVSVEEIASVNHEVDVSHESSEQVRVTLREEDSIPNKDFVLRYRVAGDRTKHALLTHQDDSGGYFTFMLYPPQDVTGDSRAPVAMIFVLDCSGSMNGHPMEASKDAILHALGALEPGDTFQVIRFSNDASQLGPAPLAATPENIRQARRYVKSLSGGGGTMMIEGIKAALDFPHDDERLRFVTFLTDGYIGNESEILAAVHRRLGASRIFSFGVGSSPNRYLLNRMARMGRGAVAYVSLNDDGDEVMDAFFSRISHPVLNDVQLDWGGMNVSDVVPARVPDLFVGRPVIVTGRFEGEAPTAITVRGRAGGQQVEATFEVDPATVDNHPALRAVWARRHIAELMDLATWSSNPELPQQVLELALAHGLMSAFTSFVAVDSETRTEGAHGTTVQVAVPMPEGVKYETTVPSRAVEQ